VLAFGKPEEQLARAIGSALLIVCVGLIGVLVAIGWGCFEHPGDSGREPYPSVAVTDGFRRMLKHAGVARASLDQCACCGLTMKLMLMAITDYDVLRLSLLCPRDRRHPVLVGPAAGGGF
jgi:hypothetical protein